MDISGIHHNPYDIQRISGPGEPAGANGVQTPKNVSKTSAADEKPAASRDQVTLNHAAASLDVIPEKPSEVLSEEELDMLNRVFPNENSGNSLGGYSNQNSASAKGGIITQMV